VLACVSWDDRNASETEHASIRELEGWRRRAVRVSTAALRHEIRVGPRMGGVRSAERNSQRRGICVWLVMPRIYSPRGDSVCASGNALQLSVAVCCRGADQAALNSGSRGIVQQAWADCGRVLLAVGGRSPLTAPRFLLSRTRKRFAEYIHQQRGGYKLPQSWRLSLRVGENECNEILCRHTCRNAGR
jgi:hypothetical protein